MDWINFFLRFFSKKEKVLHPSFYKIQNKITGHFLYHICILQNAKRHWKSWSIGFSCDVKIILIVLIKKLVFFTLFRDINESNELKLQLYYKQLALEFQIIKQLSKFHHFAVCFNIKYLAI